MRILIIIVLLLSFISCSKDNTQANRVYSEWECYDTIDGCVYFKVTSITGDIDNNIYLSAGVREDWYYSGYLGFLTVSSGNLSVIDSLSFFNNYNFIEDNTFETSIWQNGELIFIDYRGNKKSRTVSNAFNKLRSSACQIDSKGNIWLASEKYYKSSTNGIQMFDGEKWITFFEGTDFWAICFDNKGNLYASILPDFGKAGIIMRYNYSKWDTVISCASPDLWIPCMHFDTDDNLWGGVMYRYTATRESGGGLFKYDGENVTQYYRETSELPSNSVVDIAIDKHNNKWIGTYSGCLAKLDANGTWKVFNEENTPITYTSVEHVFIDDLDNIWFSSHGCLIRFKE